jgi:putative Mg2+ transporter-C (MgtC) family protein
MIGYLEISLRLVLAAFAGGLVGYERSGSKKPAGIRTLMIVSLGSALFVIITLQTVTVVNEVARLIAGIATGVGFLGAGTIFRAKNEIKGLTTAASIWIVAALGLSIGLGYYFIASTAVVLVLIILQLYRFKFF